MALNIKSKIKSLPPKPTQKTVEPAPVQAAPLRLAESQKAVEFRVKLEDGTFLIAHGDHAADIYNYLLDCERYCAGRPGTVMAYMGPMLTRTDAEGNVLK